MRFTPPNEEFLAKYPIAVGSQVTVEKDAYVSTGVVTYVEGDMLEIKLSDAKMFEKGELVKLTVYSKYGFQILASSVIARDEGVLTLFNPPEHKSFINRRKHPRIEVEDTGRICSLREEPDGKDLLDEPRSILLRNISLGGVGFTVDNPRLLKPKLFADIEMDIISGIVPCTVEINRMQLMEGGLFFIGAKIVRMEKSHMNSLRGYILRHQIHSRAKTRKFEEEE